MAFDNNKEEKKTLIFTDKRTKEKVDKHLSDINDEITADDIANIKTDVTPNTPNLETDADKEAEDHLEKMKKEKFAKKDDGNNSNSIGTSWNIIDED